MHFGEELRQERERRGISLDAVAVSTRVALRHLHALEDNRFAELPGGVFNRGIVRSYAQCCGLDADGTVRSFLEAVHASGLRTEEPEDAWVELAEAVHRNRQESRPRRRMRWLGVLLMVLSVTLLGAGVFLLLLHRGAVHPQIPERLRHSDAVLRAVERLRAKLR